MSRRVYTDGVLIEEWDDDARLYRRHDGETVEERPYTDDEAAPIMEREAEVDRQAALQRLRDQLATGVADILAARAAALDDQAKAEGLQAQAVDAKAATATQRAAVMAFTPAATYASVQLGQIRNAIDDVLARVEEVQQALAEFYAYRVDVDANAVITDNALLWLARLVSGALDDDQGGSGA